MALSTLTVKMDPDVKNEFGELCSEMGMNPSVAVNIFAKAVLRTRSIPFVIQAGEDPNAESAESIEELLSGRGIRCKQIL